MRFKEHVKAVGQALEEVQEKMSAKEKMKKGLYNSKHEDVHTYSMNMDTGKGESHIDKAHELHTKHKFTGVKFHTATGDDMPHAVSVHKDSPAHNHAGFKKAISSLPTKYKSTHSDAKSMSGSSMHSEAVRKMDPVGKADADIDNDGDVDKSDKYLHNRRKAISKNIKKNKGETGVMNPKMKTTSNEKGSEMEAKESKDLNKDNAEKAVNHDCASHVEHSEWGPGICIPEEHTIVETSEGQGYVTHYDVQFLHGIEKNVPIAEMKVIKSSHHGHMKKKKDEAMKMPRTIPAKIMPGKPVGKQGGPNSFKGMKPIPMSKESTDQGIYGIRNALRAVLEGDRSAHYKGATKPEDYDEKDKNSKGAMDMKKTAKDAETVDKLPQAFDDVSKAGRAGPSQKMRNKDNNMGDKKIINKIMAAYEKIGKPLTNDGDK